MDGINNNEIITIDLSISSPDISTSVAQKNTNFLDPQPKASSITKDSTPSLSSSPSSIEEAQVPANSDNYPNTIVSQNKASGDMKAVYIADLIRKIEANKIYPYMAKKLRQSGKVVVKLEILKSGQIVSQSVIQSSPHHLLNQAALRLVASLKHVSPIPEELHLESWQVIVPIAYVLR
jgi:protein TonB